MDQEPDHGHGQPVSVPSSSPSSIDAPSSSSTAAVQVQEEETARPENVSNHQSHHHQTPPPPPPQQEPSRLSYRVNFSISNVESNQRRDDVWSCLLVLVTFWFFASMTLILGFYGSVNLHMGPNCSRLIQTNPLFVQSIKAEETDRPGPMLYGFYEPPPLDVETNWTETHNAFIPVNFHKEWIHFLNKGSKVDVSYNVKSSSPLSLVIVQGSESLVAWIEDPSYPNTTLSWNIIYGTGKIQQEIPMSSNYYIAVGNLNSEEVEVQLKFSVKAFLYNTSQAYYKCSPSNHLCSLTLFLLSSNAAVLTSPGHEEGTPDDDWYVHLSYGPRWITYFVGSGMMTALILLLFRFCNLFQPTNRNGAGILAREVGSDQQAPLLSPKDDDLSSWGSSYDSVSNPDEDLDEWLAVNAGTHDASSSKEGENNNNPPRLCVICFDAPRDCFFLPCGHCAACFTCGTRITDEAGACPICRRKIKKVRKIFTV